MSSEPEFTVSNQITADLRRTERAAFWTRDALRGPVRRMSRAMTNCDTELRQAVTPHFDIEPRPARVVPPATPSQDNRSRTGPE